MQRSYQYRCNLYQPLINFQHGDLRIKHGELLKLLPHTYGKIYPGAIICFHVILFPTVHLSENAFFKYMDIAFEIESSGFISPP